MESVPTENDYLTATNNCIIQCSKRFFRHTVFWERRGDKDPCADCLHNSTRPCQRVQQLRKRRDIPLVAHDLECKGAMVFGHRK